MKVAQRVVTFLALACAGCADRGGNDTHAASASGTVLGSMLNTFVHGSPFYGSVVYLIPSTQASRDWWRRLSTDRDARMLSPRDLQLPYVGRTTSEDGGYFRFSNVPAGDYFLHASVFWVMPGGGSSAVTGGAWIGTATVAPSETIRVTLRPPMFVFAEDTAEARASWPARPMAGAADSLPAFGRYIYVDELPEIIKRVAPELPDYDTRGAGVEGTVVIAVLVGKDGRVKDARVTKSIPVMDEAALAAAKQYEFKPAQRGHKSVATWTSVRVHFKLE